MIGPGGQGKTAIVQHWLSSLLPAPLHKMDRRATASFCGASIAARTAIFACVRCSPMPKDSQARRGVGELVRRSAACRYCARERWALVLDGAEVVQHEQGRLVRPFRASGTGPTARRTGVGARCRACMVLTSRFPLPTLEHRRHAAPAFAAARWMPAAPSVCCKASACAATRLTEAAAACGLAREGGRTARHISGPLSRGRRRGVPRIAGRGRSMAPARRKLHVVA